MCRLVFVLLYDNIEDACIRSENTLEVWLQDYVSKTTM